MSYLSDFLSGGTTLQAQAGVSAINAHDVVQITQDGFVYSGKNTDYLAHPVADTLSIMTYGGSFGPVVSARRCIEVDPVTGIVYLATPYLTPSDGLEILKMANPLTGSAANVLATLILDTSAAATTVAPVIARLSNGNYLAVWANTGGNIKFAIFDANLAQVVAPTVVDALDATTKSFTATALSGGGFAIAYSKANPFLAVYDNTGAVVRAAAAMQNAAAFGVAVQIKSVELSNGNIGFAIGSGTAAKLLGFAVTDNLGANVVQVTILNAGGANTLNDIGITALTGYFAVSNNNNNNQAVYVKNNAGVTQGAAYTSAVATALFSKVMNDGAAFWFVKPNASTSLFDVAYVPVTGTNYVTTTITSSGAVSDMNYVDGFCEANYLMIRGRDVNYALLQGGAGEIASIFSTANSSTGVVGPACAKPGGDFTVIAYTMAGSLHTYKYVSTSVLGVARKSVVAGAAGTLIPIAAKGMYPCNHLQGNPGRPYDCSATPLVGNKGTLFPEAATFSGV